MTNNELIEKLRQLPEDNEVLISNANGATHVHNITIVEYDVMKIVIS